MEKPIYYAQEKFQCISGNDGNAIVKKLNEKEFSAIYEILTKNGVRECSEGCTTYAVLIQQGETYYMFITPDTATARSWAPAQRRFIYDYDDVLKMKPVLNTMLVASYYKGANYMVPIFVHPGQQSPVVSGIATQKVTVDLLKFNHWNEVYDYILSKCAPADEEADEIAKYFEIKVTLNEKEEYFSYRTFRGGYNGSLSLLDITLPIQLYFPNAFAEPEYYNSIEEAKVASADKARKEDLLSGIFAMDGVNIAR